MIYTGPELDGDELESPGGRSVDRYPRRRPGAPVQSGPRWAALFVPLHEGTYHVRLKDEPTSPAVSMAVRGGQIAQVEWPNRLKPLSL